MDGYQLRTIKKKEKIKIAAIELFIDAGIEKVSLAEIAKKANVSPVTIYNHFGTKDELVIAVFSSFLKQEWESRLHTVKREDLSYSEKIEKMIFDTSEVSGRLNPDFLIKLADDYPELKKIIDEFYAEFLPHIVEFFEEGKRMGYIDSEISTESIIVYLNILQKASSGFQFYDDKDKNSKLAKDLSRLFFYGFLK